MRHISSVTLSSVILWATTWKKYANPTTPIATVTIQAQPHAGKVVYHATVN